MSEHLCTECKEPCTHITRCEKDGHGGHHASHCPTPCRLGTAVTDLADTLSCLHGWRQVDEVWVHV